MFVFFPCVFLGSEMCCLAIGIRYGKYCGVGWTGCPGEKPCDDLDACCKIHDECVEKNGIVFTSSFAFCIYFSFL